MEQRRDPWAPFRIWTALTLAVYAVRASFAATWVGAIPGWVLLLLLLVALALASSALLFPGRVLPWREGEPMGWWGRFLADRRLGRDGGGDGGSSGGGGGGGGGAGSGRAGGGGARDPAR